MGINNESLEDLIKTTLDELPTPRLPFGYPGCLDKWDPPKIKTPWYKRIWNRTRNYWLRMAWAVKAAHKGESMYTW